MTMQPAPSGTTPELGNGRAPAGSTSAAARSAGPTQFVDVSGRVLEAVAARLADSVEAVADRISGSRGGSPAGDKGEEDAPDGDRPGTRYRLGAGVQAVVQRLVEILEWIKEQVARLVTVAARLLPGGGKDDESVEDAPVAGDEIAEGRVVDEYDDEGGLVDQDVEVERVRPRATTA